MTCCSSYPGTRGNIADLAGEPGLEVLRHGVTFPLYVEVDQIYHLACRAAPIFYQRDPVQVSAGDNELIQPLRIGCMQRQSCTHAYR